MHAYVEFTGSANALDAREFMYSGDTAGVSEFSCAIGRVPLSNRSSAIFASEHCCTTFGKIGISDSILLKPGRLTDHEEALIRQHPVIGRRILQGVQDFHAWSGCE